MFSLKLDNQLIGTSQLEKGDPPMGVVHGLFEPKMAIENLLGNPKHVEDGLNGWEICGGKIFAEDSVQIESHPPPYLQQFDLGSEGRIYQLTVFVKELDQYETYFSHHIEAYANSFN